jgi:gliding motility-associated-like protein
MKIKFYTKLLFIFIACSASFNGKAQIDITNGFTAICEGNTVLLTTTVSGRVPVNVPFTANNTYSGVINIGFNFTFYGTVYNQCIISPNGVISFNTGQANGPADNTVTQALPGDMGVTNSILLPFAALDIEAGGTVDYAVTGTAPNRRFVVTFCSVPLQGCNNETASFQAVLYETTNNIDIHIVRNPASLCPGTNNGRSIEGVQNAAGTSATTAPGHNFPNAWWAYHLSNRYTPNGPNNYTVAAIPYTHILDETETITWHSGGFQLGTGSTYNYTFVTTQTMTAQIANCPDTSWDTITVIVNQIYHVQDSAFTNPSQCEAADGTISLSGFFPGDPYNVFYTDQLGNPQMVNVIANVGGQVVITGLVEGTYTNIYVQSLDPAACQSETVVDMTLTDISVVIGALSKKDPACNEDDGEITLEGLVPGVTYTVSYELNSVVTSLILIANSSGEVVIPNLSAGTYSNITAATGPCNSNVMGPMTLVDVSPVIASSSSTPPSLCRANDATITLTGLAPDGNFIVRYVLDGVLYTVNVTATPGGDVIIPNLTAGTYSNITVQIFNCESDPIAGVTIQNPPITADFSFILEPGCTEDVVRFSDLSTGSAMPFTYTWIFDDGTTGSVQNPVHTYEDQGTYTVVLMVSDSVCKDTVSHDVVISHPLSANFTADPTLICQGGTVTFTDASIATLPATYYWDFANGEINALGGPSVTSLYPNAGTYNAMLVISDFIGCKDTAYKLIQVDSLTEMNVSLAKNTICAGEEARVYATYADTGSTGAMWDFGDGIITTTFGHNMDHSYELPGVYTIKITATGRVCPDVEKSLQVNVQPQPIIYLGMDTAMCPNSTPIVLNDLINGSNPGASWKWRRGDMVLEEETRFTLEAKEPGTYSSVVTIGECSATDTVEVISDCLIQVPNAFTPDGDNIADYFMPRQWLSMGVAKFKMQIYNRWGQEVFTTTQADGRGWDGKLNGIDQPQGVYVYLIEVTFKNNVSEKKQGNVTLLR